jgi:hypothetical protein
MIRIIAVTTAAVGLVAAVATLILVDTDPSHDPRVRARLGR